MIEQYVSWLDRPVDPSDPANIRQLREQILRTHHEIARIAMQEQHFLDWIQKLNHVERAIIFAFGHHPAPITLTKICTINTLRLKTPEDIRAGIENLLAAQALIESDRQYCIRDRELLMWLVVESSRALQRRLEVSHSNTPISDYIKQFREVVEKVSGAFPVCSAED